MKVITTYKNRVLAEEDRTFLMHNGIASVVHGDFGPRAMSDHFQADPVTLAVQDLQAEHACDLLKKKYHPNPLPNVTVPKKKDIFAE